MKRYCAWDIETVPTVEAMSEAYPEVERQPPANYKSEEALSGWRKKDRETWERDRIKEYSLSARTGRIVAVSLNYRGDEFVDLTALDPADEKDVVRDALGALLDRKANDLIVGFNSRAFDWPFLVLRALYHRIDPYEFMPHRKEWIDMNDRYQKYYNIDVRELITFGDWKAKGTLSQWAAWAGVPDKETAGSQVWDWYRQGNIDAIAAHCRGDARRTGALLERVYPLYRGS